MKYWDYWGINAETVKAKAKRWSDPQFDYIFISGNQGDSLYYVIGRDSNKDYGNAETSGLILGKYSKLGRAQACAAEWVRRGLPFGIRYSDKIDFDKEEKKEASYAS